MSEAYRTAKQHPVPQNIMSVEFKLVGELTIRQFAYVAGGVVIAGIVYKSGIYFLWRWLLIFFSLGLGVGMAFVPIQDRGLDTWVKSFFKALFSPLVMVWEKDPHPLASLEIIDDFLTDQKKAMVSVPQDRLIQGDLLEKALYRVGLGDDDPLEKKRREFLRRLDFSLGVSPPRQGDVAGRKASASPSLSAKTTAPPRGGSRSRKEEIKELPASRQSERSAKAPLSGKVGKKLSGGQKGGLPLPKRKQFPLREREISPPNIISGIVHNHQGKLAEGAIVLIKDRSDNPVRAVKTNSLGRFAISTPLPNGEYLVETRKGEEKFATLKVVLDGKARPPLEISAQG